jgi:hypothetical protein
MSHNILALLNEHVLISMPLSIASITSSKASSIIHFPLLFVEGTLLTYGLLCLVFAVSLSDMFSLSNVGLVSMLGHSNS